MAEGISPGKKGAGRGEGEEMKPANNRTKAGRFPKGVSGNPKGRRPGTPNRSTLEIKALVQGIVDFQAMDAKYFAYVMTGKPNSVKVEIWKVLHAYAFGKPIAQVEILDDASEAKMKLLMQATAIVMETMV